MLVLKLFNRSFSIDLRRSKFHRHTMSYCSLYRQELLYSLHSSRYFSTVMTPESILLWLMLHIILMIVNKNPIEITFIIQMTSLLKQWFRWSLNFRVCSPNVWNPIDDRLRHFRRHCLRTVVVGSTAQNTGQKTFRNPRAESAKLSW